MFRFPLRLFHAAQHHGRVEPWRRKEAGGSEPPLLRNVPALVIEPVPSTPKSAKLPSAGCQRDAVCVLERALDEAEVARGGLVDRTQVIQSAAQEDMGAAGRCDGINPVCGLVRVPLPPIVPPDHSNRPWAKLKVAPAEPIRRLPWVTPRAPARAGVVAGQGDPVAGPACQLGCARGDFEVAAGPVAVGALY